MSPFVQRPATRWGLPVLVVAVVAGGGALASRTALADTGLPERTAAQLLVDVRNAEVDGFSGTVEQQVDLGLPDLSSLGAGQPGAGSVTSMLAGSSTLKVWYAGPSQQKVAVLNQLGETSVIHNGSDLWQWASADSSVVHTALPAADHHGASPRPTPEGSATRTPMTPIDAAQALLDAVESTTSVTTTGTASVAGRPAYELVLDPTDERTLVDQVRIAVDGESHLPVRVQVWATGDPNPVVTTGFTDLDVSVPDASVFDFTPPPGSSVVEQEWGAPTSTGSPAPEPTTPKIGDSLAKPTVVGSGWSAVVVATLPAEAAAALNSPSDEAMASQFGRLLDSLPRASGDWGSGRLLTGALFSAVLTDDGRVAVGAVPPQQLYDALAAS